MRSLRLGLDIARLSMEMHGAQDWLALGRHLPFLLVIFIIVFSSLFTRIFPPWYQLWISRSLKPFIGYTQDYRIFVGKANDWPLSRINTVPSIPKALTISVHSTSTGTLDVHRKILGRASVPIYLVQQVRFKTCT